MLNLVTNVPSSHQSILDEIARKGAQKMLMKALDLEVSEYIDENKDEKDENGHRFVVRNGKAKPRTVTTGSGMITIKKQRVDDRRPEHRFTSAILPRYV